MCGQAGDYVIPLIMYHVGTEMAHMISVRQSTSSAATAAVFICPNCQRQVTTARHKTYAVVSFV
jgi:predicted RNA-binding Zn-ribbon protein involved in translation (DUF1610 family)